MLLFHKQGQEVSVILLQYILYVFSVYQINKTLVDCCFQIGNSIFMLQ